MRGSHRLRWITAVGFFILYGCLDPYAPPVGSDNVNFLMVDGFMDQQSARIQLSRAIPLSAPEDVYPAESGAEVAIETESGRSISVPEVNPGDYQLNGLQLNPASQYRLRIRTIAREEYLSDFISLKASPAIDSVTWRAEPEGVTIFVHTHDPLNQTRYYQWSFEETWEYRSRIFSAYKIVNGTAILRNADEDIHTCWNAQPSSQIFTTSTDKLKEDVVKNFPLAFLAKGSRKISRKYSILVQQRALSLEAFEYYEQLKKNTENLGTLFDPMPSQLVGNVFNVNDATEPVLGYFAGGTVTEKRIFINFSELPDFLRSVTPRFCEIDSIEVANVKNYNEATLLGTAYGDVAIEGYITSTSDCIDCRLEGGNKNKPPFW